MIRHHWRVGRYQVSVTFAGHSAVFPSQVQDYGRGGEGAELEENEH